MYIQKTQIMQKNATSSTTGWPNKNKTTSELSLNCIENPSRIDFKIKFLCKTMNRILEVGILCAIYFVSSSSTVFQALLYGNYYVHVITS